MNSAVLKTALKYAGAWAIVLTFVALLTIIFSFLGTLFCAAAGGMMMGATKASKKLSIAFSALCPAVLLGTLRSQKTELPQNQVVILAILCLAAFWMLYLMSLFLVAYEKKGTTSGAQAGTNRPSPASGAADAPPSRNGSVAKAHLNLEQLEGTWASESGVNGQRQRRVLEIADGSLELSTLNAHGEISYRARGRVKLIEDEAEALNVSNGVELAAGI